MAGKGRAAHGRVVARGGGRRRRAYESRMMKTLVCVGAAALLMGCEEPRVESYTVKKEAEAGAAPAASKPAASAPAAPVAPVPQPSAPAAPSAAASAPGAWPVPEGWTLVPTPRPMRLATFRAGEGAGGVEVVLSEFPGDTGGTLPNVNRWRGQVGLPETTLEAFEAEAQKLSEGGVRGYTVRFKGEKAHMLGAMLFHEKQGKSRFLKAMGEPAVLDGHEAAFNAFAHKLAKGWGSE